MSNEKLIGYCGLYCGDCSNYTGIIADLANDLRKELEKNKFEIIAENIPFKEFKSYPECCKCLGAMAELRCEGCREGRSNFCKIGECAEKKGFEGCLECEDLKVVKNSNF